MTSLHCKTVYQTGTKTKIKIKRAQNNSLGEKLPQSFKTRQGMNKMFWEQQQHCNIVQTVS